MTNYRTDVPCFVDERISKKKKMLTTFNQYIYTIVYLMNYMKHVGLRKKMSFIGQGKRGKRFHFNHFKYYEVCAQTAQGQRLKQLVKWPVLNMLLLKTFKLLVFRSSY